MNKSLVIALVATIIGVCTLAVGLYILATTPAPAPEPAAAPQSESTAPKEPLAVVPQISGSNATLVPDADAEPGSEAWCEAMMATPDGEWSDADARLFSQHCIYQ
ncbi:DUF3012 domain-containing protein [Gilvimarinus sp. DA14]|uniref:DUF3012 domain-containing protein n=1 Tax=Gilvimarinus sp. DA14 TaxID=2956798 RepID=UPI0020B71A95|nr:DUF3012 domain-containing protein [Gilvimarinus sp. DA14]UTF60684.1 DUF3012 domain-containing protein [Gilvimarinus sp. DA14]